MSRSLAQLLVALGVLAIVCGIYALWYYEVEREAKQSAELQAQIQATIESAVTAAETSDTLASLAADEAAIEGYRIKLADIVAFLERIEATGRSLSTSVEVVSVADKPGSDGRMALTVRVIGSFDAVLRTLGAIEYGPYDSKVTTLTFDTPETGGAWTAIAALSVAVDATASKP
jgi:hypothetical protein